MKKSGAKRGSRMKSYLVVAAIAAVVLLASTKIPKIRAFVYGPPTA